MLKRLSERSPAHELGTAHATHLKHQARTSSQLNVQNDKSSVIDLDILEQTSSTITLCWCCTGDTDYFLRNEIATTEAIRENIGIVKISIRKSSEQKIFEWEDVYQGKGRGCTIEYLEPNTSYHIRLIPLESSHQRHNIRGPVYISARTEQLENIE